MNRCNGGVIIVIVGRWRRWCTGDLSFAFKCQEQLVCQVLVSILELAYLRLGLSVPVLILLETGLKISESDKNFILVNRIVRWNWI